MRDFYEDPTIEREVPDELLDPDLRLEENMRRRKLLRPNDVLVVFRDARTGWILDLVVQRTCHLQRGARARLQRAPGPLETVRLRVLRLPPSPSLSPRVRVLENKLLNAEQALFPHLLGRQRAHLPELL